MRVYNILILLLLCLIVSINLKVQAQEKWFEIGVQNKSLEYVLNEMEAKYHIHFSYSIDQLPSKGFRTFNFRAQTIEELIEQILSLYQVQSKRMGKYWVITKGKNIPQNPTKSQSKPSGYNMKALDLKDLAENKTKEQVWENIFSNNKAYLLEKRNLINQFETRKDSLLQRKSGLNFRQYKNALNALMVNLKNEIRDLKQDLKSKYENQNIILPVDSTDSSDRDIDTLRNINIIETPYQFTFIFPLGTNGRRSGLYHNKYSLNTIVGFNGGVKHLELGGVANIIDGYTRGVQLAGAFNISTKAQLGVQMAGAFNLNFSDSRGLLAAGAFNFANKTFDGYQLAGAINLTQQNTYGAQLAGAVNIAKGEMLGSQLAGAVNMAQNGLEGLQIGGAVNLALAPSRGVQIAGAINVSNHTFKGVQVAGGVNYARNIHGTQIGPINITDTLRGIQIGLISYAKNGYRAFQIYASDATWCNLGFKMGAEKFYNIFNIAIRPEANNFIWSPGYGIGTMIITSEKSNLSFELMCHHLNQNDIWTSRVNMLNQAKITYSILVSKGVWFEFGPVLNIKISKLPLGSSEEATKLVSWNMYDKTIKNTSVIIWPGVQAGIKF